MDFVSNQKPQIDAMLADIGMQSLDDLFTVIPANLRVARSSHDDGLSEYEGLRLMEHLAAKNTFLAYENYLGAGAYEHHVPAIVNAITSKSEFLTSYTPYQAEVSQGMLQAIFEFQSAICALTGMDVANASVYDGASACAEAILMSLRHHKTRNKVLVGQSLNPHYRAVIKTYLQCLEYRIIEIPCMPDGGLDREFVKREADADTAAILLQNPNYFGVLDSVKEAFELAKAENAITILCADPIVYGLCPSAKELEADIAVGDCQPLGLPLEFGGPYVGYMACKQDLMRQLPGRIVGETVDTHGKRGFVLTLQAREQHIRREKATSNICTNQALAALASLVTLLWYGKEGMKELALTNYQRATYLKSQLQMVPGLHILHSRPTFNEFAVQFDQPIEKVLKHFQSHGIQPGVVLKNENALLVAVTEVKSLQQIDRYVAVAKELA